MESQGGSLSTARGQDLTPAAGLMDKQSGEEAAATARVRGSCIIAHRDPLRASGKLRLVIVQESTAVLQRQCPRCSGQVLGVVTEQSPLFTKRAYGFLFTALRYFGVAS